MHPRRKARIGVLGALYAEYQTHENPEKILRDVFSRDLFNHENKKFIRSLFLETLKHLETCDTLIENHLENWEFNRIALLDKLILRMAITEMLFIPDVPPKAAISEAIEIAKEFSTEESSGFVNGILDAVYKQPDFEKIK
ncbi:MAG TPA: transcription antitermination factor NusB [Candidatus Marinimicrobia bacterium]|nr:transcription antitermination factor NusB [Candidatus Neomarinimicrobiota bacterium]